MANLRVNKITGTEVFETTGSVQFDGTGDYLSLADSSDFDFGSDDFTVEGWIYLIGDGESFIFGQSDGSGANATCAAAVLVNSTNSLIGRFFSGSTSYEITHSVLQKNVWNHFALVRNDSSGILYLNGIAGTSVSLGSIVLNNSSNQMSIGRLGEYNARYFNGHISNLRILKGKALYTSNFTPPTRELTVTPETVLLCCQSTTNTAQEATGKTITVNGNAVANELTPGLLTDVVKSGGSSAITGSVEFDGTGDYLSLADSEDWHLDGDFTLECWFYPTSTPPNSNYGTLVGQWESGGGSDRNVLIWYYTDGSGNTSLYSNLQTSTTQLTGNFPIANASSFNNSWHHTALVVNNNQYMFFVDGIKVSTSTVTGTVNNSTVKWMIGASDNGSGVGEFIFEGFISNLRLVKGTALYTTNFIPPTRELKNIPGTVLLCCQDSNDPTTEATGKTITGYGDLDTDTTNENLITNGNFTTSATDGWTIVEGTGTAVLGTVQSATFGDGNHLVLTATSGSYVFLAQEFTTKIGSTYRVNGRSNGADLSYISTSNSKDDAIITDIRSLPYTEIGTKTFVATQTSYYVILRGGTGGGNFDLISVYKVLTPNRASNFTPPVGFDGSVTFEGTTKINTENYFYLPTGNTESRDTNPGVRGVFSAGYQAPATPNATNVTDYINISSTGNAQDFGDSTSPRWGVTSCSSSTRGLIGGGTNPGPGRLNTIDYITIASTGDAQDFGDLTDSRRALASCSSSTRGIFAGGYLTVPEVPATVLYNIIEYVTISSTGNAQDFGDTTFGGGYKSGFSSPTRGVIGGNYLYPTQNNVIDYITIASTGNAQDFGDLTQNKASMGACSNSVRGLFGGGFTPGTINNIDYVTIASTGNAQDFGDLLQSRLTISGTSSQIRGIFGGGAPATNVIQYVSIMNTGNSIDFGDLTVARGYFDACSNGHGGLG